MTALARQTYRLDRRWPIALTALLLVATLVVWVSALTQPTAAWDYLGIDFTLYRDATLSWLAGQSFYPASQVAGPYVIEAGAILYPPPALLLFAPFAVLPAVLWWIIPFVLTGVGLWRLRPDPLVWPLLVLPLLHSTTQVKLLTGNPVLWVVAFATLGAAYAWPSVLVLIKPTLLPFALLGAQRRSWWIGLGIAGIISLVFLPMWPAWIASMVNARTPAGLLYSVTEIPMLTIAPVAWLGREIKTR